MRFLRRSFVGLFLFALTIGVLAFAGQTIRSAVQERLSQEERTRPSRERVLVVNVVPFEPGVETPILTSFGEVRSRRTLELRAPSAGTVVALAESFEDGARIQDGDLLLRIDPRDAQSTLDLANTDLAEAQAEMREAVAALALAREDVAFAREQLDLRERVLERQLNLIGRGLGSEEALESAELAEASAKQSVLSRRQALAQAEARVEQGQNTLNRRQIALAEAERGLAETELFAEFSGSLSEVAVVKGGLVQNNERIGRLIDPKDLEVSFRVSTAEYARLLDDEGQLISASVDVALDVLGLDLTANGSITRESADVGDGQSGRLLFAKLDQAPGFRPGDFVTVKVKEPELRFVARLPASAVDAASTVLVLGEEDRLEIAKVNLVRRQGDEVLVRSRDLSGRQIVAQRSPLLGEGIKVRPLSPDASTEPEEPQFVELSEERRAKLVAFVEGNKRMPADAKKRVLAQLQKPKVPAQMVARLEARIGG